MDVESGMSGKNRNAVHFNPSKRKGGGAEALQNCVVLPHSAPSLWATLSA